jgi:hypothetical protein
MVLLLADTKISSQLGALEDADDVRKTWESLDGRECFVVVERGPSKVSRRVAPYNIS